MVLKWNKSILRLCFKGKGVCVCARAGAHVPVFCACAPPPPNVTSRWFFGLIRLLLAAVSSLYCKGNSESEEEGGLILPQKSPDWPHTSGVSTILIYRTLHLFFFIRETEVLSLLLIYSIPLSLWFTLTLREGRNGGQHVPGRRYVCQCGSFYQTETPTLLHPPAVMWR